METGMQAILEYKEEELSEAVDLIKRNIPEAQKRKFEGYAAEILPPGRILYQLRFETISIYPEENDRKDPKICPFMEKQSSLPEQPSGSDVDRLWQLPRLAVTL